MISQALILASALAAPPAFVSGPHQKLVEVEVFRMLLDYATKHNRIEKDPSRNNILILGKYPMLGMHLRREGYPTYLLNPIPAIMPYFVRGRMTRMPFSGEVFSLIFSHDPVPMDAKRSEFLYRELLRTVVPGGFYMADVDSNPFLQRLLLRTFRLVPIKFRDRYSVFQKIDKPKKRLEEFGSNA